MRLPKGVDRSKVVAILTGSNYQVAARVWLMKGHELATRVIIDTGSGVSLIREDLLPRDVTVKAADMSSASMFDMNGGLLPIKGTIALHVRIGSYTTEITVGVVPGMSVPMILGTDYTDRHVPPHQSHGASHQAQTLGQASTLEPLSDGAPLSRENTGAG